MWRSRKRGGLIALMLLSVTGAAAGVALQPSPAYRARALIVPSRVQAVADSARTDDATTLAAIAKWPGVIDDARKAAGSGLSETQVRAGVLTSVSSTGSIEVSASGQSYESAEALANALAGRVTQLGRSLQVRAGTGVLALDDFGIGAFSAAPKRIMLRTNAPTYRPALEVLCSTAVGCGAGSTVTLPFQSGRAYTVSAWVRSLTVAPSRLIAAVGHDAQDVRTTLPQMVRGEWSKLSVSWDPKEDLGSTSVTVQTTTPVAADFEIGEVTIADTSKPRAPLFGSLDPAAVQRLLVATRQARVVPALPAGNASGATTLWSAIALACGLLALSCAILLRRINRRDRPPGLPPVRSRARAAAAVIAGLVLVGVPAGAATRYPGSVLPFLLFQSSYTALLLLAIPRPRRYAYTALAVLLFLGFWMKFNLHAIFDYAFQEPTGSFDGSGQSWDKAMTVASAAAVGVVIARLVQLGWAYYRDRRPPGPVPPGTRRRFRTPDWYLSHRRWLWSATIVGGIAVAGANAVGAFYETGVDPRIILPLHLNVLIGWAVDLGAALWIAVLVHWEEMATRDVPERALIAPLVEAPVATISALSRGIYLFHLAPYGLVLLDEWQRLRRKLTPRRLVGLAALVAVGFVVSLAATSALRLAIYPEAAPVPTGSVATPDAQRATPVASHATSGPTHRPGASVLSLAVVEASRFGSTRVGFMVHQIFTLFTDRWTGLEGVMAISAYEGDSWRLFRTALTESPSNGQHGRYQLIAKANLLYANYPGFTFLSLPGVVGILDYSSSLAVVLLGMTLITAVLLTLEWLTVRFTNNPYLAAVSGVAIANELTEASFPYLLGTFFVLLVASLACIAALYAWRARPSPAPA